MKPDRWDALSLLAAALLGSGVWGRWGWSWAFILWGLLILALVIVHGVSLRQRENLE